MTAPASVILCSLRHRGKASLEKGHPGQIQRQDGTRHARGQQREMGQGHGGAGVTLGAMSHRVLGV